MSTDCAPSTTARGETAAALLDWLAGLMSEPMSLSAVKSCRTSEGQVLFDAIAGELGCTRGIEAMRRGLDAGGIDTLVAARLSGCYTRLFDGPGGPATVSLYESTYSGRSRRLQQQSTTDMESMLGRCNMAVRAGHREPADHLCVEVALFVALLRSGEHARADELLQRLLTWVPQVVVACAAADPSGFYRGVSIALLGTLRLLHSVPSMRACHELSC